MFSIKCQEIVDKNTGVHLAFGDHGRDKSTVWVRITARINGVDRITMVTIHRDGDVINITPLDTAPAGAAKPVGPTPKTEAIDVTPKTTGGLLPSL